MTTLTASVTISASDLANLITNHGIDSKGRSDATSGASGKSWLLALAGGLGEMLGDRAAKMEKLMEKLNGLNEDLEGLEGEAREENTREFQKTMTEFQAESQMFSIMSNTTSTALKAIGEGITSIARKQ
ncbi:hypothetical protein [Luteimonas sp. TWI1437]|uniref:hypothetical protein n=1 Tax=unclassified Luteimonas TaxID=2629088 RepID=UPI003208B452